MNDQELLKTVNPSYSTAKGCLALLMQTGEPDAIKLGGEIDLSELQKTRSAAPSETEIEIIRGYTAAHDARYNVWNRIAEESDCDVIIDLPCGYLPHALAVSRMGKQYYGFDLPVVINEIEPAVKKLSDDPAIHFSGVDATNYDSMKNALDGVTGKICIITDGMLGFFSMSELREVCASIKRLLSEFGGSWYTSDAMAQDLMAFGYEAVTGKDPAIVFAAVKSGSAQAADIDNSANPFSEWSYNERKNLIEELGFNVRAFPYSDKLPDLRSCASVPGLMERMRDKLTGMIEWELTAKDGNAYGTYGGEFYIKVNTEGNTAIYEVGGRLDTMTAPELLQKFNDSKPAEYITLDARNLDYISSAGLRVLLIMSKSAKEPVRVINCSDSVKEIFDVTGFADIMTLE
jgi:anti-anti-sigma factor